MKKDLDYYLHLRYPMEIVEAEEGGYFAHYTDLPGCMAQGGTIDEVVKNLESAKRAWIEVRLEDGADVPPPHEAVEDYSGRFLVRVPKSVHRELAVRARRERTSLNQYVVHLLSWALGRDRKAQRAAAVTTEAVSFYDAVAQQWGSYRDILTNQLAFEALSETQNRFVFGPGRLRGFAWPHLHGDVVLRGGEEGFPTEGEFQIELTDRIDMESKQNR